MKIWILDSEANSLTPDRFWCVVLKEYKKNSYKVFINDDYWSTCVDIGSDLFGNRQVEALKLSTFKEWLKKEHEDVCSRDIDKIRYVGHNCIDFDFHWLEKLLGADVYSNSNDIRDTYVLSRLASPVRKGGHSVEAWAERLGGGLRKTQIEDSGWDRFDPIMITRCLTDTEIQEQIYTHLREHELRGFSLDSMELEQDVQRRISRQRRDGVYVDEQKLHNLHSETKIHADYLEQEIRKVFPIAPVEIRTYEPRLTKAGVFARNTCGPLPYEWVEGPYTLIDWREFNIDSPLQRVERLLKVGWKPTTFSKKTNNPTFTEDSLDDLPEDAPKEVRLFGEYLMSRSRQRLAEQLIKLRDASGYIHGYIDILGAGTHRCASNNPNLQNIPSAVFDKNNIPILGVKGTWGYEARNLFTVENPLNFSFVDIDASGIQLRGLAHYGNDNEYISLVSNPVIDIHNIHAEVLQCSRPVAKTFIYAFLMGAGAKKLIFVLGGSDVSKGKELLKRFYERFPFLKEFKERLDRDVERGYFIGLDGRLIGLDREKPHKAMAVALQSYEVIIMKKAMCLYQNKLFKNEIPFIQRLFIHDEFLVEVKNNDAEPVGKIVSDSIVDAGRYLQSKCPLAAQYRVGKTWADVH